MSMTSMSRALALLIIVWAGCGGEGGDRGLRDGGELFLGAATLMIDNIRPVSGCL